MQMRIRWLKVKSGLLVAGWLAGWILLVTACQMPWGQPARELQKSPIPSNSPLLTVSSTPQAELRSTPLPTANLKTPALAGKPNIIVVLVDDMASGEMAHMPQVQSLLVQQGALFSNFYVDVSLCCPARASILRSQYAHNTQIFGNRPPLGGFEKFVSLGCEESTIATWLQSVGYRTALIGKYLNGYPPVNKPEYIPPGWDEWYSPADGEPYSQYRYTLNENGRLVRYGYSARAYGSDVYAAKALDFITRALQNGAPFFAYIAPYAPHGPSTPARRHAQLFQEARAPRVDSFNEKDVSDKPQYVRSRPRLKKGEIARIDSLYRNRLRSLQAVDEMIANLVQTLRQAGALENTYLFFTSDNGFLLGQHRLGPGKIAPYEESIRVPLVVRGPGVPSGIEIASLSGNIDLAPTWAELAGVSVSAFVDGRSLAPLWSAGAAGSAPWRGAFLVEQLDLDFEVAPVRWIEGMGGLGPLPIRPADSGVLEPPDALDLRSQQPVGGVPPFRALRTAEGLLYVEYETGERELYDLRQDPYQLENLIRSADPNLVARLSVWLTELSSCAGPSCRLVEDRYMR